MSSTETTKSEWLNVYHDRAPHGDSILEGDAATLCALAGALLLAAASGYSRFQPFDSEGEGYDLHIVARDEPAGDPARPSFDSWGAHDSGAPAELESAVRRASVASEDAETPEPAVERSRRGKEGG